MVSCPWGFQFFLVTSGIVNREKRGSCGLLLSVDLYGTHIVYQHLLCNVNVRVEFLKDGGDLVKVVHEGVYFVLELLNQLLVFSVTSYCLISYHFVGVV